MRLEMTMSKKEDEDVFKNCIEEIIEEGFTLDTIRNNAQKVKSIIRIDENPEFQKGIGFFNSHAPQKTAIVIMSQNKRIVLIFPSIKNIRTENPNRGLDQSRPSVRASVLTIL